MYIFNIIHNLEKKIKYGSMEDIFSYFSVNIKLYKSKTLIIYLLILVFYLLIHLFFIYLFDV